MAIEKMKMPQLGESVTEGTISTWLVKPGDHVQKYDPIAEVMTDKVNAEVPSSYTGTIQELLFEEGETVPVGELICSIQTEGEGSEQEAKQEQKVKPAEADGETGESLQSAGKPRYSPAVLKLSQEHDIDLKTLNGTGAGGRITRKDVLKAIESGPEALKPPAASERKADMQDSKEQAVPPKRNPIQAAANDTIIPVSGIRKAIAQNMTRAKQEIPHAWTMVEADVTGLVSARDALKKEFKEKEGYNLTYFAFFVKAVAQALKEFPEMNSMWDGDRIIQRKDIHLSIAVATDDALYVPVIKHADEKTIKGIAREIYELAGKVRSGKLSADDMRGGTFTVNNTGSFGSVQSMGIINHPQAAILQVESIVKKPVVMEGNMIAIRNMVNLCLSLDHRVLDGLVAGRFLARLKGILEEMNEKTISIY
ncbi:branched-chain alpha-keto acid dehydrogenase subunit E2 [Pradoshia eiseniae]|uniref:Dihydrolipoamide acetyltransferase component of pyruvate dehydrogenase complex n=1 Tax=Pradoshia eiseniae TaxID=2064768 RepID=A0A2S7N3I3_9BACI|nr:dihydrolipoamide acetyltransferase family protein [Pradoshia eiseniae]PQD96577.1 branched-chain alpha-keto acid dehydrogenase subunit E2 [Pradoshia eiseniae]